MTTQSKDLLKAFDSLSLDEQREVAVEILRRSTASDELSDEALSELAAEVFRAYDAEEAERARP